jgi:hypothetical protein
VADPFGDTDRQHPLAGEARAVDVLVRGDDDPVRVLDIVVRQ